MTNEESASRGARVAGRIALGLVLAACALFAVRGWRKAVRPQGNDFTIYREAARAVLEGRSPAEVRGYLYPVTFAVLVAPIGWLPVGVAAPVWQLASLALLLSAAWGCARLATGGPRAPPWLVAAVLACVFRTIDSNLANCQVNAFTLAAVVAALEALRAGHERRGGALLGLGLTLKLLPGLLLVPLALRRRWSALAAGAVTALALGVALPALVLGPGIVRAEAERWLLAAPSTHVREFGREETDRDYMPGQSLPAVGTRLLTDVPATRAGERVALVELDPTVANVAIALLALAHVAVAVVASLRRTSAPGSRAWVREYALWTALALVLAPLVHKAHLLWLMLPYAALLAPEDPPLAGRARVVRWTLVGLSLALVGLSTPAILGREGATRALAMGTPFLGLELVFLALVLARPGCAATLEEGKMRA